MPISLPIVPFRNWASSTRISEKRTPIKPIPLNEDTYKKKVWEYLKAHERVIPRIHSDPKGIPTLGAGYALATKGLDGRYRLRSWEEIGRAIDPEHPYVFSNSEKRILEEAVGYLNGEMPPDDSERYVNDPTAKEKDDREKEHLKNDSAFRVKRAKELIPPATEKETPEMNRFGFTLTEARARDLISEIWPDYRKAVYRELRRQARARGWSEKKIDEYIGKYFQNSDMELALTSLLFNGVYSPNAIGAVLDGDRTRVREEILYLSNLERGDNKDVRKGLANRRRDEADLATGDPSGWSEDEQKAWRAIEGKARHKSYREEFPGAFGKRPIGRALSPEARRMLALAGAPPADAGQAILLKSPAVWTEDEARTVMRGDDYWNANDPFARDRAQSRVGAWFRHAYGNDRLRLDAVGRPVRPVPIRALPKEPAPARAADGGDLYAATEEAVAEVIRLSQGGGGLDWAIRMLQMGLNRFGNAGPPLAEDGDYGSLTDLALKTFLAGGGSAEDVTRRATLLDLLNSALQSGTLNTLLQMLSAALGLDLTAPGGARSGNGGAAPASGGGAPGGGGSAELAIRSGGAEAFVRNLSSAQVGAGVVHVRAHSRRGGSVGVSAYERAAPAR